MRTRHSAFLVILGLLPFLVSGCAAPAQPVTTVWQKLGIPQATLAIRDQLTNPFGNNPQLERKPPLKRIADAAALDPENPLLVDAAEVKKQEDLAPQKIKALKFIGGIGCCCYELEDALLSGLSDCTPDVRLAAIEAIETSTTKTELDRPPRRCNQCAGKREKCIECKICEKLKNQRQERVAKRRAKHEALRKCLRCKGRGCQGCTSVGTCCGCNCSSCCTEAMQKKLKDMAYGVDDNGCFKEPVAEVREAAAALLAICPPIPEKQPDPVPDPGPEDLPPGDEDRKETDEEGNGEGDADTDTVPILRYSNPHPASSFSDPYNYNESLFDSPGRTIAEPANVAIQPEITEPAAASGTGIPSSNDQEIDAGAIQDRVDEIIEQEISEFTDFPPIVNSEPVGDGTLNAEVTAVDRLLSQVDFKFDADYEIPLGSTLLITTDDDTEIEMKVIDSTKAKITARYEMDEGQLLSPGQVTAVGIISVHQD